MRIFFITNTIGDIGGSEIITRDLLAELVRKGHELLIFTPCKYYLKGAKTVIVPSLGHHAFHKFESLAFVRKAVKEAKKFKPDIVHSHSNCLNGFIGQTIRQELKIPHVLSYELISDQNKTLHTKTIHFLEKNFLSKIGFDIVTAWTESMKQKYLLPWGVPEKKIEIVPAALDLQKYDLSRSGDELKKQYGNFLLSSIKTLFKTNVEGLKFLIDAFEIVSKKHSEPVYLIVGKGDAVQELQEYINSKGLEERVKIIDKVLSFDERQDVWAATMISPHAFLFEFSIGISLMEYMAFGNACVVTDVGNVRNFVEDSALVVKPSVEEMAEGISKLIEDESLRNSLSKKSAQLIKDKYSVEAVARKLEGIYAKAAERFARA